MQLSESERRVIAHWQKSQQRWPKVRWICLVVSGTLAVFYALAIGWFHSLVFQDVNDQSVAIRAGILASASPLLWGGCVFSCGWFGLTLARWKSGEVEKRLLLKLLADLEKTKE